MSITPVRDVQFNAVLMAEDAAEQGLSKLDWARRAGVSDMAVLRFLRGDYRTPKMAKKLAKGLRRPLGRYLLRTSSDAVA